MHTVRNRIASRPSSTMPARAENTPPVPRSTRQEPTPLLRTDAPFAAPARGPFPVPPLTAAAWSAPVLPASRFHVGGVTTSVPVPDRAAPTENRQPKRRSPKGKKARKAAARMVEAQKAEAQKAEAQKAEEQKVGAHKAAMATAAPKPATRHAAKHAQTKGRQPPTSRLIAGPIKAHQSPLAPPAAASPAIPFAAPAVHPVPVAAPAFDSAAMLELCLQAEPALALTLPSRPEPLVEAPEPEAQPEAPAEAEPAVARVLTLAEMPELLVAVPVAEMPVGDIPVPVDKPLSPPAAALTALAALAEAQNAPLPRSRALVPARRQGLVDVIAFLLRDSGRRLARWSARRHKSRAERELLRSAEARHRALISELEALAALRRRGG